MKASLTIGSEFAGHRVEALAARGGMGVIYRATHLRLGRTVALKLVAEERSEDSDRRERFKRESQIAASIDHPNVIPVYEAGEEDGVLFISMRWVDGTDLRSVIDRDGPLEPAHAARLLSQVASALDAAHGRDLIHRDVKPANILMADEDHVYLTDFGLSKRASSPGGLTSKGSWVGTVDYVAPEQIQELPVTQQTDVYSLGCVLYEMLSGRVPYVRETDLAKIWAHVNAATPSLLPVCPNLPPAFDRIVRRAMAKSPSERYGSAGEMAADLLAVVSRDEPAETGRPAVVPSENGQLPLPALLRLTERSAFVGRESQLDYLRDRWDRACGGQLQLVLLEGEPGIGKTRLAAEFCVLAYGDGATVLYGRSDEDALVPYQSFVEALGQWAAACPPERLRARVDMRAELSRLVPQLTRHLPDLAKPPEREADTERFLLFEAVSSLLAEESGIAPIVLVLEDLHWADKSTLALLKHLVRSPYESRLLVLGTYREAPQYRTDHLSDTLAFLHREHRLERLLLVGLDEMDVGTLISSQSGREPERDFARAIHGETEGNPFFVEEMLRHLVESGAIYEKGGRWASDLPIDQLGIPEGLKEVIGQRLARLQAATSQMLSLASVGGREFGLEVLERLTNLSEDELDQSLDEAVAAQLIEEVPGRLGRYSFSHALIHETLYDGHTATRRVRLHRQIAEAIEDLYGEAADPPLPELAHHFLKASEAGQDVEKAVGYAVRAGERATAQLAHKEAAGYYRRALAAFESQQPQDDRRLCELLLALGGAEWRAGDFDEAKEAFRRAAELAEALGAAEQLADAALGYGGPFAAFETGTVDEHLVELLEKALAGLSPDDSPLRARVTSRLAEAVTFSPARARWAALSEQAIAMARRIDDRSTIAYVLERAHWATWGPENLDQRIAVATEIIELAEKAGDISSVMQTRVWRLSHLLERGDIAAVDAEYEACRELAARLRQPYNLWQVATIEATLALLEGRFSEVERLSQDAVAIGMEAKNRNAVALAGVQILALRREEGRLGELEAGMAEFVDQYPGIPGWRTGLAWLHTELGNEAEARREFEGMAGSNFAGFPRDVFWLKSMTLLAEVCAVLGDTQRAGVLYEALMPYAGRCIVDAPVAACSGSVRRLLGCLAATLSRFDDAAAHFEAAVEVNAGIRARPWVAHTQLEYGRMLLARDPADGARARELLSEALDTAEELGMTALTDRAQALRLQADAVAAG